MLTSRYRRITLLIVLCQAVCVIVLESLIASIFLRYYNQLGGSNQVGLQRGVPVYLLIFILAQAFQVALSWYIFKSYT
jgi:hypothetical protein